MFGPLLLLLLLGLLLQVLSDGAHDLGTCEVVTQRVLSAVFKELHNAGVLLEGMLVRHPSCKMHLCVVYVTMKRVRSTPAA